MSINKDLINLGNRTKHILKVLYRLVGYILLITGNSILGQRGKYQIITRLIEGQFMSLDVSIKVQKVSEFPLFTRFYLSIDSVSEKIIDWKYFLMELIHQLGCLISDVSIERDPESKKEEHRYMLDITKTAIGNLEKGLTQDQPILFEPDNTMSVIKKAIELIKTGKNISPKILAKEININGARAEMLYSQLKKVNFLDKKSENMTIN